MEVIVFDNSEQVAATAADMVCEMVSIKPNAVLGLATGSTSIALYRNLIQRYRLGALSCKEVTTFNLDEYLGIAPDNPQSYRHFMAQHLFDHVDIDRHNTHLPECPPGIDPRAVGPAYEEKIRRRGGIDLQILGIGSNGHIGFNEPTSSLGSRTRVKTLARGTIEDNGKLFRHGEFQPHMAITMGIATILDARRILLLATGEHKAAAVRAAVEGAISAMHPASVLQQHPRVRVIVDAAAASQLTLRDYFRWVHEQNASIAAKHGGSADADPWFQ